MVGGGFGDDAYAYNTEFYNSFIGQNWSNLSFKHYFCTFSLKKHSYYKLCFYNKYQ